MRALARWALSRGGRFYLLAAAALLLALTALGPSAVLQRDTYDLVFILDISQSMNALDGGGAGPPASRLAAAKAAVREALKRLPCGSRAGLGIFTEYRSFLLLAPVEVCAGYAELAATLERMDWRMSWAGASQVSKGLRFGLDLARGLEQRPALVFISDGHEAPPVAPELRYPVENAPVRVPGLIVGVGGDAPAAIPKFDMDGRSLGYWDPEDVVHTDTSAKFSAAEEAGRDARLDGPAPPKGRGTEHLSSLKETYLRTLAAETGLGYVRLDAPQALAEALQAPALRRPHAVPTDLRWVFAALALAATIAAFAAPALRRRISRT